MTLPTKGSLWPRGRGRRCQNSSRPHPARRSAALRPGARQWLPPVWWGTAYSHSPAGRCGCSPLRRSAFPCSVFHLFCAAGCHVPAAPPFVPSIPEKSRADKKDVPLLVLPPEIWYTYNPNFIMLSTKSDSAKEYHGTFQHPFEDQRDLPAPPGSVRPHGGLYRCPGPAADGPARSRFYRQ